MLRVRDLSVEINNKTILKNISFNLVKNDMLIIVGPNASGKTTIVKSIMNDIKYSGEITLVDKNIKKVYISDISKQIGVLMQNHNLEFDNTVYNIVSLGRYTYSRNLFGKLSSKDKFKINEAMEITDTKKIRNVSIKDISGGELQRVFLALVLAQDPNILILDEPTNHLDIKHQIDIFNILKQWCQKENRAIMAITHDLNLVKRYGTKALLIKEGQEVAYGKVNEVLTKKNLNDTYDFDVFNWMQTLLENWK